MGVTTASAVSNGVTSTGIMRVFIVLALVALASAGKVRVKGTYEKSDFAAYKSKYNKSFGDEENMRHQNYLRAIAKINAHNAEYDQGMHTWFQGEKEFLDWTQEELDGRLGYRQGMIKTGKTFIPTGRAPDAVDWRTQGAVQHVKNQGQCGSCWAFGTVGALEGQHAIVKGSLPDCSEQQLVDCDHQSSGCNGGLPDFANAYIQQQGSNGLDTQSSYPYTGRDGTCDTSKTQDGQNVCATITGHTNVGSSESALQQAVGSVGPCTIGVNASPWSSYSGGIFDTNCGAQLNHAVLCVGYDTNQGYWIVKNSWGGSWGEQGYIRIVMGKNMCGLANDASYPNM